MIDTGSEELLSLGALARRLPKIDGRTVNVSTVWRWSTAGLRGAILETVTIGGRLVTTWSAYQRFEAVVAAGPAPAAAPAPARKRKRVANAAEVLKRAGIRRPQTATA